MTWLPPTAGLVQPACWMRRTGSQPLSMDFLPLWLRYDVPSAQKRGLL